MHDPFDRTERIVADRVGALRRAHLKLGRIGHELARDRIVGIAAIDQVHHRGSDRHRIARRHRFERGRTAGRHQTGIAQLRDGAQGGFGQAN